MRKIFCLLLACSIVLYSSVIVSAATFGELNALGQAKMYLSMMGFSYSGLVKQLEFEGYSHKEAIYGADHCDADWNEEAVKKAKEYLEIQNFSKKIFN